MRYCRITDNPHGVLLLSHKHNWLGYYISAICYQHYLTIVVELCERNSVAKLASKATFKLEIQLTLDEEEAQALGEVCGYKISDVIAGIASKTTHRINTDYDTGLTRFFSSLREQLLPILESADKGRKAFIAAQGTT